MFRLGVDTGGTFTDFVLLADGQLRVHKVLSTPEAPEQAILQGVRELGLSFDQLTVVHGSTVATNAVLEGKGVKTAYVTNYGLGDVLSIGRQARRELYHLQPLLTPPPVPFELCLETGGRLAADASVVEALSDAELASLREQVQQLKPDAVAINLLFSFLDDRFERQLEQSLADLPIFICRSSEVLPEYKEYERGIACWLNAYIGPLVQGYLKRLQLSLAPAWVSVMQSAGGTMNAEQAGRNGVQLLLSGPAGGLNAALHVSRLAGVERVLTFDMGGTSTDVALLDGEIRLTTEGRLADYPVAVPMVDMHTIGAGGGSIAYLDVGGMLRVGPESAGASPGPACYGKGGKRPTVTDANLILGRLRADASLGGYLALDVTAAEQAMDELAQSMDCDRYQAAAGIVRVANENMAQALRVISVQKGFDPRHFSLMCFGGAGGLHICELAEIMGMREAVIPVHGGVLSALGMLVAPHSRQLSRTCNGLLEHMSREDIEHQFGLLLAEGQRLMTDEGLRQEQLEARYQVDLRYRGQSYTLSIPWHGIEVSSALFHETHAKRYGHKLNEEVELVNLRLSLSGPQPNMPLPRLSIEQATECEPVWGKLPGQDQQVAILRRTDLRLNQVYIGPVIIIEDISTSYISAGWSVKVDELGNLLLSHL